MEELVIEKNVPLVHDTWNKKLDALEVDESFIFDEEKPFPPVDRQSFQNNK
jgi:hypothetical protein